MQCRLCDQDKKLIKAHIIPRSFYEPLRLNGQAPVIYSSNADVHPKISQTGIYDKEIVCEDCERIFSPWDDYSKKFLFQELHKDRYRVSNGERLAYNFGPCDYEKLKLFFLSVLWRSAVSKKQDYIHVQLGPFEEKLKHLILVKNAGDVETFAVALSKFNASPHESGILSPHPSRYDGVKHYKLYLGGCMAIIKVSNQSTPKCFRGLYVAPNQDVYCLVREFKASKEYAAMIRIVKNA